MQTFDDARKHVKYGAISAAAGVLGVVVARSSPWIGIPLAVAGFALAAFLLWKALTSLPRAAEEAETPPEEPRPWSEDDGP